MGSTITAVKAALRREIRAFSLSPQEKAESDGLLLARFLALPQVTAARTLLLFWGVGMEPDTSSLPDALTARDKAVYLPRCLPQGRMEARQYLGRDRLRPGAYGIPEPDGTCPVLDRDQLDLILVPNLCCDRRGCRLGQGGGYYDRYLSGYGGHTVALCRDALLVPALPREDHDRPVGWVLTETSLFTTG